MTTFELVFGPPGTGKTTHLIGEVERELAAGTAPERIAYVSFTRAAIGEARDRVRTHLNLPAKRFPWFRTIHSMAHHTLGIQFGCLMDIPAYRRFGLHLSLYGEDRAAGARKDDRLLLAHHLVQATGVAFRQLKLQRNIDVPERDYAAFAAEIKQWMTAKGKMEYGDLLEEFVRADSPLPVDVAIIDEGQDLTPQQWRVMRVAFRNARRVVVAGDDDQAIFEWAGASPNVLLALRAGATVQVLNQSHRVPEYIRLYADRIITRLHDRQPKQWSGTAFAHKAGIVRMLGLSEMRFAHLGDGESYLLLAQHRYYLDEMSAWLTANGWTHFINDQLNISPQLIIAAEQLHRIRNGERIPCHRCRELITLSCGRVRQRLGDCVGLTELPRLAPLSNVKPSALTAVADARRRWGSAIPTEPKIRLSTIHAAKGTQADNVLVNPLQTPASAPAPGLETEADARLYYVAATRARRRLTILNLPGVHRYEMPA